MSSNNPGARAPRRGGLTVLAWLGILVLVGGILFALADSLFGYVLAPVGDRQVGIQFRASQPYQVVGPGVYTDVAFFADLKKIDVAGLAFESYDPEVLTKDKQAVGVKVTGTVHRPDVTKADVLMRNWAQYSTFYTNDEALIGIPGVDKDPGKPGLMANLSKQAMKVCVGDRSFEQAVVGSTRDDLRQCIDTELDKLAKDYGLEVRNVIVPEVDPGKEVRAQLDAITKARLDTEIARQRAEQAKAEADRELQVQQGAIRVEQGKVQEKSKQDAVTAKLEQEKLTAQRAVIEAEKTNQEFAAKRDLEIAKVKSEVAAQDAKSALAPELAKAAMIESSPRYADLQKTQALASAYKATDKIIIPQGTDPYLFIGGQPSTAVMPTAR